MNDLLKVLFLCSQNKRRSLTAEKIFQKDGQFDVRSAGTESNSRVKVTGGLIGWADLIFVMEKKASAANSREIFPRIAE